jgi:hypothetical protein
MEPSEDQKRIMHDDSDLSAMEVMLKGQGHMDQWYSQSQ